MRAAANANTSGAGLPLATLLAENNRGPKNRNKPAISRLARTRSIGDEEATAFGPRIQVSAWATWGSARNWVRNRRNVSIRDGGRESGRQLLARGRLDGGKNIGRPATVETARHDVSVHGDTGARERLRQHGAGYRFAVYKYTITIEDDQGPLR